MLSPENWLEYEWKNVTSNTVAEIVADVEWRVWRVTINVASTTDGGLETIVTFGGAYDVPFFNVIAQPGETVVVEPRGMFPALVTATAGAEFRVNCELIRKVPPI
jgi:hypothetical protein